MRHLFALFVVMLVAVWGNTAQAARLETQEDLRRFCDQVMASLSEGNFDKVGEQLKASSFVPASEIDATIGRIKLQMTAIAPRFGGSAGYEFIKDELVGQSFIRLTYVQRLERNGLPWHFIFYRTPNGWSLNTFFFFDTPNILF